MIPTHLSGNRAISDMSVTRLLTFSQPSSGKPTENTSKFKQGKYALQSSFRNSMQHACRISNIRINCMKVGIYRFPEATQFHRWTDFQEIRIPPPKKTSTFQSWLFSQRQSLFFWGGGISWFPTSNQQRLKPFAWKAHSPKMHQSWKSLRYTNLPPNLHEPLVPRSVVVVETSWGNGRWNPTRIIGFLYIQTRWLALGFLVAINRNRWLMNCSEILSQNLSQLD